MWELQTWYAWGLLDSLGLVERSEMTGAPSRIRVADAVGLLRLYRLHHREVWEGLRVIFPVYVEEESRKARARREAREREAAAGGRR